MGVIMDINILLTSFCWLVALAIFILFVYIRKRKLTDASQPRDNREKRAIWSYKWYMRYGAYPNSFGWKWTKPKEHNDES